MLVVSEILVRSLSTEYVHVVWKIEDTEEDTSAYDFYVLRSGAETGPYDVMSGPLVDTFVWRDNASPSLRLDESYYYRVRVVHRASSRTLEFGRRPFAEVLDGKDPGGASRRPGPNLVAREISRRLGIGLSQFEGRTVWIYPIRAFGARCSECWNSTLQERSSWCTSCYGSGFAGGFYTPLQVFAGRSVSPVGVRLDQIGTTEPTIKAFKIGPYPEVKVNDVVIESTNDRWRVNSVEPSEMQGALVSQNLICARIPRSDVEYLLPLKGVDPIRLADTEERQFVSPTNLESLVAYRNQSKPREV